jgi:hypothetical protein
MNSNDPAINPEVLPHVETTGLGGAGYRAVGADGAAFDIEKLRQTSLPDRMAMICRLDQIASLDPHHAMHHIRGDGTAA